MPSMPIITRECSLDSAGICNFSELREDVAIRNIRSWWRTLFCSQERRRINKEIEHFRRVHQRIEDRRDYDLYDPETLKKSLPSRVDDDDPSLGPASAQKCVNSLINSTNR